MKRAFTIIELLVVISIIALLIAILLPSLAGARDRARFIKWAGWSHGMRTDTRMVAYYNFEQQGAGHDKLWNRAAGDPFLAAKADWEPASMDGRIYRGTSGSTVNEANRTDVLWEANGPLQRWKGKGAMVFDDTQRDHVDVEDHDWFDLIGQNGTTSSGKTKETTVWISVRVENWSGSWNPFVSQNGEPNGWQLRRHSGTNDVNWTTRGNSTGFDGNGDYRGNQDLSVGSSSKWYTIAGTYGDLGVAGHAMTKRIYIDGKIDNQRAHDEPDYSAPSSSNFCIGCRHNGNYGNWYEGWMDEVAIMNGAVAEDEAVAWSSVSSVRKKN
jgi:prepilin-type N-terminal cleavage/methylation domain-containing protein